jgi:polyferredoxin
MKDERTNQDKGKCDLLQYNAVASVFKNRKTQFLFQLPAVVLLILAVFAGFFGIQNSSKNLATISIWVIWWSLLIISLALVGRIWCLMCPFGAIGDWAQRLSFYKKVNDTFSLNRKLPARFRNLSLAALFFLVITWADFQFNLVNSPLNTAYFIFVLLVLIVIISIIFERRSFCRYICPITGLIGLYSMFAPFELRAKERKPAKPVKKNTAYQGMKRDTPAQYSNIPVPWRKTIIASSAQNAQKPATVATSPSIFVLLQEIF